MLKVFLDLDRTLFKTDSFDEQKWQLLADEYSIDAELEHSRQPNFYVYNDDMYAYDFNSHIEDLSLPLDEVYGLIVKSSMNDGRLEYPGVKELIDDLSDKSDLRILTYGHERYQNLKYSLCPSLEKVAMTTTLKRKGQYFRDNNIMQGYMVDDKPIGSELPRGVKFIQVSLDGLKADQRVNWPILSNLGGVADLIANY